ncbi:hypothetical protein [Halosegnis marinus]|uniref:Preprotein translocase subunit TatA n=1 Tax=Halosegnis marinus TaxID=3034023 RepID=A0ABD5ZMK7_9EURY|nr:hypothetical protein [Halosegnis sp. DT85]
MFPLQFGIPGGPEILVIGVVLLLNLVVIAGFLGGVGYFVLRIRSGGSVDERLDRIERKIGRLEAEVEHLREQED